MSYKLKFLPAALKEWSKLDKQTQEEFKNHLTKRLLNPHVKKAKLRGELKNCYKIKLHSIGYRLVYQVIDKEMVVIVIAIGKRDKLKAYTKAIERLIN